VGGSDSPVELLPSLAIGALVGLGVLQLLSEHLCGERHRRAGSEQRGVHVPLSAAKPARRTLTPCRGARLHGDADYLNPYRQRVEPWTNAGWPWTTYARVRACAHRVAQ
jgi:hypothetical protein